MFLIHGTLDVRCPRCGGRAAWSEPFEFRGVRGTEDRGEAGWHRWGGWWVRERYPSILRWKPPRGSDQFLTTGSTAHTGGHRLRHRGVVRCGACHLVAAHVLHWPADAWFQWDVRGTRLWACDSAHARTILHYVESLRRDAGGYPGYRRSLERLPSAVLAARNRALVAKRIRVLLSDEPDPPAPAGPRAAR